MAKSFGVNEDIVLRWLGELKGSRNYAYYFLLYWRWFKAKEYWHTTEEMVSEYRRLDEEGRAKHVERLMEFVKGRNTGSWDRKQVYHAVKNFYTCNLPTTVPTLPTLQRHLARKVFSLSELDKTRDAHRIKLTPEQIRRLIRRAKMPYQAIFTILFQSGMGLAEFQQFNRTVWRTVVDKLESREPVQVQLYRSKTSTEKRADYYTFLSRDSLEMLKDWLSIRDRLNVDDPHCFLTFRKNDRKWVPTTSSQIGEMLTETARKAGLIEKGSHGSANRYPIHCHEFRDRLRSVCELYGVRKAPAEFFLGHDIDKLHYDKSPWYDMEHYRREYKKIEGVINVLSTPSLGTTKDELRAMMQEEFLKTWGWTDSELQSLDLSKLTGQQVQDMIQQKQAQRQKQEPQERAVKVPRLK